MKIEIDKIFHTKIMAIDYEVKGKKDIHVGNIDEAFYVLKRLLKSKNVKILKIRVPYGFKRKIKDKLAEK